MIRLLEDFDGSGLRESHYSEAILSHLNAYGAGFDFCRFYEVSAKKRVGIIAVFNGSMIADFVPEVKLSRAVNREIAEFADFQSPYSIELPRELIQIQGFSGYSARERVFFDVPPAQSCEGITVPDPEAVFKTVYSDGGDYGLWLTDTMRRLNAGQSRLYAYETSVLTVRFLRGGSAYITDVATPPEDRGKGYARMLLGGVSGLLAAEGFSAYLAAPPDSVGYYRRLGYSEFASDRIFVKNKDNGESK